ncbi:ILK1 [Symbiodinium natans]|uniref:ILK1 protein n=1 Tax=Symbiodinium natans TaxID=878477 RepID=A0A812RFQ3_9DINO|nr:ILK1 [Symbiodinium natans]
MTTATDAEGTQQATMQLCYAAAAGDCLKVKALLSQKCDPTRGDYGGKTPLHIACANTTDGQEVVRVLLEHGAEVNVTDNLGQTPMDACRQDIASRAGSFAVKAMLQEHGAKLQREEIESRARASCLQQHKARAGLVNLQYWQKQIGKTLKSAVHLANWKGTVVVVKCAKMHQSNMVLGLHYLVKNLRKSRSLMGASPKRAYGEEDDDSEVSEADITEELLHEIQLLASLRHPDVVLFLGACLHPNYPIMFVSEFMGGGDLEHFMCNMREKHQVAAWKPPLWRMVDWSCAIGRALAFLHGFAVPIVHRDLKPLNLLLTKNLDLKMTDFGISKMMSTMENEQHTMTGGVGSYLYMAPEVVRYEEYNEKVDVYSYGLIMYYISSGKRPFHHITLDPEVILQQYCQKKEPRPLISDCPKILRGVIEPCWQTDKFLRPSAEEITVQLGAVAASRGASCDSCSTM